MIVGAILEIIYLFYQLKIQKWIGEFNFFDFLIHANSRFSSIFGAILFSILFFYIVKKDKNKRSNSRSLKTISKNQKAKSITGFVLLVITLFYYANKSQFLNLFEGAIVRLIYKPTPPTLTSPWPWNDVRDIQPSVANIPPEVEKSIQSVAEYIAQKESDPYLRIKALHDYVVSQVSYDVKVLETGIRPSQDAQTVFKTHKAVCEGYANLFMALGRAIGENVVVLNGNVRRDLAPLNFKDQVLRITNSQYDWTLHAWNSVKILDNWYLIDTTWDDSSSSESVEYETEYLMLPPEASIVSHFPEHRDWQLLSRPIDRKTFEKNPILKPRFFAEGLDLILPTEYQTKVTHTNMGSITVKKPKLYQKEILAFFQKEEATKNPSSVWELTVFQNLDQERKSTSEREEDLTQCQTQKTSSEETQILCQFPEPGAYKVLLFGVGQDTSYFGQFKFTTL